ncbi:hypothetical protein GXW82_02185 [Streptacidiphilus sp. 4-A2]|nr:hypothetical protein [Streptacidiphilus sp. 4-A2]
MTDIQAEVEAEAGTDGVGRIPLSVGQQAMWVAWQIDPEQWTHIIPLAFDVQGDLDTERLRAALAAVAERHPHLLGRVLDPGSRAPVLDWSEPPPVPVREHTTAEPAEQAARDAWQRPFDLRRGPLIRADVIHHGDGTLLLIAIHHLVCDGASVLALLHGLTRAWRGEDLGAPDEATALRASAEHSHTLAEGPEGEPHREYWRGFLGGEPPAFEPPAFELPAPLEPPRYQVLGGPLDPELLHRVGEAAQQLRVSRFTVMFAAFFVLLRRYSGQDRLLANAPFHGRSLPGTQGHGRLLRQRPAGGADRHRIRQLRHRDHPAAPGHARLRPPRRPAAAGHPACRGTHRPRRPRPHPPSGLPVVGRRPARARRRARDAADRPARHLGRAQPAPAGEHRGLPGHADAARGQGRPHHPVEGPGRHRRADPARRDGADYLALLEDLCAHPDRRLSDVAAVLEQRTPPGPDAVRADGPAFGWDELTAPDRPSAPARTIAAVPTGVTALVLDQDGNPAPVGVPGRLWLGTGPAASATGGDPAAGQPAGTAWLPLPAGSGSALRTALRARTLPGARLELLGPAAPPAAGSVPAPAPAAANPAGCLDALAGVWGEVLVMDPPQAQDSFFELGGHSLLVGQLVTQVQEELGVQISLRDVFDHPRLGELAALIDERLGTAEPPRTVGGPVPQAPQTPASGFQERIWLAERLDPGHAVYNIVLAWRIQGRLDPGTLEKSLAGLVAQHEILRTRFLDDDGRLVQRIEGPWSPALEQHDLAHLPGPERSQAVERWLREAARTPFDPAAGRLARFALVELDPDTQALLVCAHHLVLDGESVQVLAAELGAAYHAAARGGLTELPPPDQYRDYAAATRHPRTRAAATAAADFWAARLAGAPARLPLAPPSPAQPDGAFVLPLPDDLLPRLRQAGTRRGSSWFMIAATAVAAALHLLTGRSDLTFAVPVADSAGGPFPRLLGPRLGTAILRSRREPGQTLGDLLDAMRETVLLLGDHPGRRWRRSSSGSRHPAAPPPPRSPT